MEGTHPYLVNVCDLICGVVSYVCYQGIRFNPHVRNTVQMHRVILHSSVGYTSVTCAWHVTRMGIREYVKKTNWLGSIWGEMSLKEVKGL